MSDPERQELNGPGAVDPASALTRRRLLELGASGAVAASAWSLVDRTPARAQRPQTLVRSVDADLLSMSDSQARAALDGARALGANTLRFPVPWERIEPEEFSWSARALERVRELLAERQLAALPVVVGAPDWLPGEEKAATPGGSLYPTGHLALNGLGRFVERLTDLLAAGGELAGVQIWDQPNAGGSAIREPAAYGRMLATAAMHVAAGRLDGRVPEKTAVVTGPFAVTAPAGARYLQQVASGQPFAFELGLAATQEPSRLLSEARRALSGTAGASRAAAERLWLTGTAAQASGSSEAAPREALAVIATQEGAAEPAGGGSLAASDRALLRRAWEGQ